MLLMSSILFFERNSPTDTKLVSSLHAVAIARSPYVTRIATVTDCNWARSETRRNGLVVILPYAHRRDERTRSVPELPLQGTRMCTTCHNDDGAVRQRNRDTLRARAGAEVPHSWQGAQSEHHGEHQASGELLHRLAKHRLSCCHQKRFI